MKSIISIFICFVFCIVCSSCSLCNNGINKIYIPLQTYTTEEQEDLINFLKNNNINIVNKILIDYGELRGVVKVINNK